MKKIFNNTKTPIILCILSIIVLLVVFVALFVIHAGAEANLGKQQQWASGKDSFDRAYEIAALDKETPDKTLYVPKLVEQIGKTVPEAVANIGQGATIVSTNVVANTNDKVVSETVLNLTNESGDEKTGTPSVVVGTNNSGYITKISFSCNTWLLGYGKLSFTDLINNENVIEKTLTEAGLFVENDTVNAPSNRASYTSYDSDGTTVVKESCDFSGSKYQDGYNYQWSANLTFDYSRANVKGNLAETVRVLNISISI